MAADTTDEIVVECAQARTFAQHHFGTADLGHKARNAALLRVAEKLCRHPGGTLPTKLANPADYHAMDRLMNRPEVTHDSVLAAHLRQTRDKMLRHQGVVLVLHDQTVLDYSGLAIPELGPVGNGGGRGYVCYNALAVNPVDRDVLGLAQQVLHRRATPPRGEGVKAKRERLDRESRLWSTVADGLGTPPAGTRWLDVADRGADVFEFLATEARLQRVCLVRACYNRVVVTTTEKGEVRTLLFDHMRSLPPQGKPRVQTIADPKSGESREARLVVAWAKVWIQPPHVRRGDYPNQPIAVWAVRVWEVDVPAGAKPVEWVLLCTEEITSAEQAWEKVSWYGCRCMVEEYHKGMKTGCQIEDLQFHTAQALRPMIALLSVVAVLLLNLRVAYRRPDADTRPAVEIVDPIYEETLRDWRFPRGHAPLTVKEYFAALARLGGHMNRKSDGPPGWLVLFRGWMKLHWMVTAVEAERRKRRRQENRVET